MATLTGKKISESYKDLLQVSNSNAGVDGTLRDIEDGEGTASVLQISSSSINIKDDGALQINETAVTSTAAELNLLDGVTATTAEINYLDGVTSNIQTQLNAKIEATLTTEQVEDIVGGMLDGTETGISVSYDDTDGNIDFVVATQSDNNFTTTLLNKLNAIEDSATADQTASEIRTLVDSASDSNVFTDADHSKLDGIEASATADQTDAEIRTAVEAASDSNVFTDADHSKLDGIEASADVTDTANVTSAGALMDSELTSIADVKALDQSVISGASPTFGTANMSDASNKRFMTDAQETKLDSVESNADVTDTANVTSAGALMDSEVTNLSFVKGLTSGISSGNVLVANANVADNDFLKIDGTSVEGRTAAEVRSDLNVEDGATADQTAADIRGLGFFDTSNDGATSGLDSDLLDGQHGSHYLDFGNFVIDDDEIPIAKLASDNVSYGGVSVTLGASDATPAFNLSDATSLPIVAGTTGTLSVARGGTGQTSLDNFITLGSMTVGNYAASVAGTTNEIEVTGTAGEGTAFTIGLPADVVISNSLTVNGTTTTIDTQNLIVEDPLIKLAKTNNAADSVDIGFYGLYDTSGSQDLYAGLFRDANDSGKFKLFKDLQDEPTTTVDVSGTGYAKATLVADIEGNVTGNATGNAGTATALATGRDISLTGDVTGTTNTVFDGTGNVSIAASIANNSVDLGTHTTGNYVATLTAGNLIDLQNNSGEGATPTIDVDLSELSTSTSDGDGDFFAVVDSSNAQKKLTKGNINISGFNNDSGFTSNAGTVTSVTVTGGDGLTGGGSAITSSGTATLAVGSSSLAVTTNAVDIAYSALSTISDDIATGDHLIFFDASNSNAVQIGTVSDLPFTNNAGTITSVTGGTGLTGSGSSGGVTVNVGAGTGISVSSSAVSTNDSEIVHDNLSGFVANEHKDHSSINIASGAGLTGGGDITATRTLAVGAGTGITANADDIEVDINGLSLASSLDAANDAIMFHDSGVGLKKILVEDLPFTNNSGDITSVGVTAGTGLTGGGSVSSGAFSTTLALDFSGLTDMTGDISGTTEFILQDGTTESRKAASEIKLSAFNNDSSFTSNAGTVTSVSGGNGLTGTVTSSGSLAVGAGDGIAVNANDVEVDFSGLAVLNTDSEPLTSQDTVVVYNQSADAIVQLSVDDIGGGAVSAVANGSNNRIATFSSSTALNGESNLTFDGNDLSITGNGGVLNLIGTDHSYIQYYPDGTGNGRKAYVGFGSPGNDTFTIANESSDADMQIVVNDGGVTKTAISIDASAEARVKLPNDNQILAIGAGQDLKLYHLNDTSIIYNATGGLTMENAGAAALLIKNSSSNQDILFSVNDGGVTTTALQIDSSEVGRVILPNDNQALYFGTAGDLRIQHNGTDSLIRNHAGALKIEDYSGDGDFYLTQYADNRDIILQTDDGSGGVTPYITLDGSAERIQFSKKAYILDNVKFEFGDGADLQIYHDGSNSSLQNNTGVFYINQTASASMSLQTNNIQALEITSAQVLVPRQDVKMQAGKKLYLDGGTHTYIDEPSGDQLRLVAGGTEVLKGYSGGAIDMYGGSINRSINIGANRTADAASFIDLVGDTTYTDYGARLIRNSGANAITDLSHRGTGALRLRCQDAGAVLFMISDAEKMRVASSGNVGIGVTSPGEKLDLRGGNFRVGGFNTGSDYGAIFTPADSASYWHIYNDAGGHLAFGRSATIGSSEKMRINSSGNVGIGTTSPSALLDVGGDADEFALIGRARVGFNSHSDWASFQHRDSATSTGFALLQNTSGRTILNSASGQQLQFRVNNADGTQMIFDGSQLGIGNVAPQAPLHIGTGNTSRHIKVSDNRAMFGYNANFAIVQGGSTKGIKFNTNTDTFGGSPKMTITTAGDVGIGTESPNALLDLSAHTDTTSDGDGTATMTTSGQDSILLEGHAGGASGTNYGSICWLGGSRRRAMITAVADGSTDTDIIGLSFYTQGTDGSGDFFESMRIGHDGDVHFDKDVIAFSTTPSDIRLKENFKKIENGLDVVTQLEGHTFNWKKGGERLSAGFKAQEVEKILPHLVDEKRIPLRAEDDKEYKILRYEEMIPYLVEAIKEQQEQINELKEKLNG